MFDGVGFGGCCIVDWLASSIVVIVFSRMFLGAKFFVPVGWVTQIWRLKSKSEGVFNANL